MVQLIVQKRCGPIGLELASRHVQMIQFTADEKKVIDAVRWDLPPQADVTPEVRARQWSAAISDAYAGRKFRGREVVVCLGAGELFVQNIRVPKGPTADLHRIIQQEATGRLPFPVAEAEVRYVCAGEVRQGDQAKREVILLACHQKAVEQLLSVVDQAGFRAAAVEIEPSALLRAYTKQGRRDADKDQRAMYVRVSGSNTTVVIAQGHDVFFVKYIDIGGHLMDEAVAQHLKISLAEAATLRRHNGERRSDQQDPDVARSLNEATRGVTERLLSELSLCIRYHSVTFRGQPLAKVVVGGTEAVPSLLDLLGLRLSVKCELGDPLRSFETSLPAMRRAGWDVTTGLALRDLN